MFICSCLFCQQVHLQHQLNLCYPEYSCEHAPVLERAVGCFSLTKGILLSTSNQKRCANFRHLWLAKVKNLTIFPASLIKVLLLYLAIWETWG